MRQIDRYILRETLIPTVIGLVALTFVFLTRQLGSVLEVILLQSPTPREVLQFLIAVVPSVLTFTLPMAVLIGVLTGFGRMSSDNEAIALRAAGVPMKRILRPVMVLACAICALNVWLSVWVAPDSTMRRQALLQEIGLKHVSMEIQPRIFNESIPNWVLYVQDTAPNQWRGIMVADTSNPEDFRITFARTGTLTQDEATHTFQLELLDENAHVVSQKTPAKYSFSVSPKMTIKKDMPPIIGNTGKTTTAETRSEELLERIRQGKATNPEQVELNRRIAFPFACIVFALVGLPLGVSTTRGSKSLGLVISLIVMLIYYLAVVVGTRMAGDGNLSPILGTWLPNLVFAGFGLLLLSRSDYEYRNRRPGGIRDRFAWLSASMTPVHGVRRRLGHWATAITNRLRFFRLLDIYVLRGFSFYFLLVLTVFSTLFVLVTLFELLPDIVKNRIPTTTVVTYFLFLLPEIICWIIPITVLLTILISLGTLTKTNEILAVKAGAISLYRLAMPLLVVSLGLSGAIYLLQDFVLPYSSMKQDQYHDIIKGRAPQTYKDPLRKWMIGTNERMYNYSYFDPALDVFGGISILKFQPNSLDLREWVFAARAQWLNGKWKFEDGWVRKLGAGQTVTYEPFTTMEVSDVDRPEYFKREVRPAAEMTYGDLKKYVGELRKMGFDVTELTLDLHRKLSFPIIAFIMAIIGVPFSFKTGQKGAFYGIGFCILIGMIYWSTFELFGKLGGINMLSPLVAAWFPDLIFGLGGLWMMLRVKT